VLQKFLVQGRRAQQEAAMAARPAMVWDAQLCRLSHVSDISKTTKRILNVMIVMIVTWKRNRFDLPLLG